MKTSHPIITLGSVAALATVIGIATPRAFAGPGPQYWQQQAQNAKIRAEKAANAKETNTVAPAAVPTANNANSMACPACKTERVREFSSGLPNGKGTPRWRDVGIKHTCKQCGGAITAVRGTAGRSENTVRTTNSMKQGCPVCGPDAALCVTAVNAPTKV